MGIFDALTGDAGHAAAGNQRNVLAALIPNMTTAGQTAFGQAGDALRTGFAGARGDLQSGYDASTGAIKAGAGGALDFLDTGTRDALARLTGASGTLTAGGGAFTPLSELAASYRPGSKLYGDALGINGPEGNARATASFTPSLSYDFNLNQGIDAINRRRNAAGMLGSGNADRDAQVFGSGLASQEQNKWLDRLSGFMPLELAATSGAATGNAGVNRDVAGIGVTGANMVDSSGRAKAGVSATEGGSLADLARAYYGARAGTDTGEGAATAGNLIGGAQNLQSVFGSAIPQFNDTFKQDAKASTDASTNSLNLGMNLAKLAVGAAGAGGIPGGGSFMPSSSFMNNSWGW
jgi:hypothetical protein